MEIRNINYKGAQIPFLYEFDAALPIARLKVVFKAAGVCAESKKGAAKMLANLLNEGTKKLGSAEFNRQLEIRAVDLSFDADFEKFSVQIDCLSEHFDFAFGALCDIFAGPNFSDEILEKLKIKTLGEIAANDADFDYQAALELKKLLYGGSNLAYDPNGDEKSVKSMQIDDLKSFASENFSLNNVFFVLCGKVKPPEFKHLLDNFTNSPAKKLAFLQTSHSCQTKLVKRQTQQAYVYFGAPYSVQKDQRYLADVATFILGSSGFGSRLMEEIRVKKGLAYSVYAKNALHLSRGSILGHLQTKNESRDEAIALVRAQFDEFTRLGVTQSELDAARNFLLGSQPLSKETLFKRVNIASAEFYEGFEQGEFERKLARIQALKLGELNDFIASKKEISQLSFALIYDEI